MSWMSQTKKGVLNELKNWVKTFVNIFFLLLQNVFIANYEKNSISFTSSCYFMFIALVPSIHFILWCCFFILWCRALLIVVQLKNQHTTNCWWRKNLFLLFHCSRLHPFYPYTTKERIRIFLHSNNISILHQICKWFRITSIQTISQYSCCDEEKYMRDLICMKIFSLHSIKFLSKFYVFCYVCFPHLWFNFCCFELKAPLCAANYLRFDSSFTKFVEAWKYNFFMYMLENISIAFNFHEKEKQKWGEKHE